MPTTHLSRIRPGALAAMAILVLAALVLLGAAPAPAPAASAAASRTCEAPEYPGLGYFTSLKASRTSCKTGKKVALGHYKCRTKRGGRKGRCTSRVSGYRCTEKRNSIPTQIDSRVTCKKRSAKITFTYQQDL